MKLPISILFWPLLSIAISSTIPQWHATQSSTIQRRAIDIPAEWEKAWCRGSKLSFAMIKNEQQAAAYVTPVRSPWDGDLVRDFRTWGYREIKDHRSELCDFGPDQHDLKRAFGELGIGTASSIDGGPNHCYYVEHQYGSAVERPPNRWPDPDDQYYIVGEKRYRVSSNVNSALQRSLIPFRKPKHTVPSALTRKLEQSTS